MVAGYKLWRAWASLIYGLFLAVVYWPPVIWEVTFRLTLLTAYGRHSMFLSSLNFWGFCCSFSFTLVSSCNTCQGKSSEILTLSLIAWPPSSEIWGEPIMNPQLLYYACLQAQHHVNSAKICTSLSNHWFCLSLTYLDYDYRGLCVPGELGIVKGILEKWLPRQPCKSIYPWVSFLKQSFSKKFIFLDV